MWFRRNEKNIYKSFSDYCSGKKGLVLNYFGYCLKSLKINVILARDRKKHLVVWLVFGCVEYIFSHCGPNCPENTWEKTNQSSGGWCKTSWHSYWRDVAIGSGVTTLCFEQLNRHLNRIMYWQKRRGRKIINHCTPEGTRESHPGVHDLQHPWLGKPRCGFLQIMDNRMGFPCPFPSVVMDSIILFTMYHGFKITKEMEAMV